MTYQQISLIGLKRGSKISRNKSEALTVTKEIDNDCFSADYILDPEANEIEKLFRKIEEDGVVSNSAS